MAEQGPSVPSTRRRPGNATHALLSTSDPAVLDATSLNLVDIGSLASWSVSSSKPNHGVGHLSDPNLNTLWQSEGGQPHLINIQFPKKQSIVVRTSLEGSEPHKRSFGQEVTKHPHPRQQISIYADVARDDSYTPQKISIRVGTHHGDLHEVKWVDLHQPTGWQHLRIGNNGAEDPSSEQDPIRAHLLQVAIVSNHMNGKDTHVRGLRVFAPKKLEMTDGAIAFTSIEFKQHETIR
ncbi:BQ2448_3740 [Microbotryum intermedium]|uniref:Anaphase-promoting complex subunit 10 n=1 Tax=Microbotryum intermedium TaxID=269621 RepID=A0A238FIG7_9BASI|nr:BQ2448_3740 [Microbotryum intermedium]